MRYFTREELEDITKKLLEAPTRETLKELNEKYNGSTEVINPQVDEIPNINVEPTVVAPIPTIVTEKDSFVAPMEAPQEGTPITNFNIPTMEVPKIENSNNNIQGVSNLELPKLETPVFNNHSNEPINFSGNLFETPKSETSNLMQTTDNFSTMPNTMPTTEVPVTGSPFFGPSTEPVNNPIPIDVAPAQGPTMFGQFEQNYM